MVVDTLGHPHAVQDTTPQPGQVDDLRSSYLGMVGSGNPVLHVHGVYA